MNSRGKKLTPFEIFKSDLEKAIKGISPVLKDDISKKIDNSWMDLLWGYANLYYNNENQVVRVADDGFMHLFNNIFRLELFLRGIEAKNNRQAKIEEIVTEEKDVINIMSIFDVISDLQKNEDIIAYWDKLFYYSDDVCGKETQIRLFWLQKQNQKPVFHLAMERDLSVPELCYFYALYLVLSQKKTSEETIRIMRVVRNLVTANVRANSASYGMLGGFLHDIEEVVANNGRFVSESHTFISTACNEEHYKINNFDEEQYKTLLKYENHFVLQGSVMLFINKYFKDEKDMDGLLKKLSHFEDVFNNHCLTDNFDAIRIALLDKDIEYMQYEPSMEDEKNLTRRYFVHNESDFSQFFISNERRRNQDAILEILWNNLSSERLLSPEEKSKEFGFETWQYYMAKYNEANIKETKYGCYAWDDKENCPLEMIILNSSYHSINNIEWKMLNYILIKELNDEKKYSLGYKASSPLTINNYGITLTISQKGWIVGCNNQLLIEKLSTSNIYSVAPIESEESLYIFAFCDKECGMDFIDLGKQIVADIENAYESFQSPVTTE